MPETKLSARRIDSWILKCWILKIRNSKFWISMQKKTNLLENLDFRISHVTSIATSLILDHDAFEMVLFSISDRKIASWKSPSSWNVTKNQHSTSLLFWHLKSRLVFFQCVPNYRSGIQNLEYLQSMPETKLSARRIDSGILKCWKNLKFEILNFECKKKPIYPKILIFKSLM